MATTKRSKSARPIHELLIILRDSACVVKDRISFGLCYEADRLYDMKLINPDDLNAIVNYISSNRPNYIYRNSYGWKPTLWKSRLRWLNKHIELTKPF